MFERAVRDGVALVLGAYWAVIDRRFLCIGRLEEPAVLAILEWGRPEVRGVEAAYGGSQYWRTPRQS